MLIEELKKVAEIVKGNERQKRFYDQMIKDAEICKMYKLSDVFTESEIDLIKVAVNPKQGECYKNATLLANLFPDRAQYVEGKFLILGLIGTEHAWNKVDGKYVDITSELVLKKDPTAEGEEYMKLCECDWKTVLEIIDKKLGGYCGSIYFHLKQSFLTKQNNQ